MSDAYDFRVIDFRRLVCVVVVLWVAELRAWCRWIEVLGFEVEVPCSLSIYLSLSLSPLPPSLFRKHVAACPMQSLH